MLTRSVGIFAALLFLFALFLLIQSKVRPKPKPASVTTTMPALAMEFVKSDEDLPALIGKTGEAGVKEWRDGLLSNLKFDYVFIIIYWLLFIGIAAVLMQDGERRDFWIALVAILFATAAALCDVAENLQMTKVINSASVVGADVATPGFLKWLSSFMTVALLSFTFFGRGSWVWVAGGACLLIAGLGFVGLVSIKNGSRQLWPVGAAFVLMIFVLLPLVAFAFTLKTELFVRAAGSS
jgi:hypothetical protein